MRGAFPGDPRARARPDRPPRAGRQLRRLPRRAGLGQHDRQARRRHRRLDADHLLPRLRGAAPGRPGDERPHVRRRGDPGQPGDPARARGRGDRARGGRARLARRARPRPPARPGPAAGPGRSRRCPTGERPWDGLRVLVTAGGTREPIDPVRFIGNRSSGRMGIALAAAAARRGAEVTLIAANVALPEPAGVRRIDVETAAELAAAAQAEFPDRPRPADGRRPRRLPRRRGRRRQAQAPATAPRAPPGADRGHPRRPRRHPRRGPDDRRLRRRARRGRRRARPRQAGPQGRRPDRPQRRLRPDDRLRERRERRHPDRRRRARPPSRTPPRTRSPRRSSTESTRAAQSLDEGRRIPRGPAGR